MVRVDNERLLQLCRVFKLVGLERIKSFEELDPQLTVARVIYDKCGLLTPHILFTNALISYQLRTTGEEYWLNFSELVINRCPRSQDEVVDKILESLKYLHNFAVKAKERRLNKLKTCTHLYKSILHSDLNIIREEVAECLDAGVNDKTIVFAIKMLYYGLKALGKDVMLPFNIPIPVDRRVIKVSYYSGLIVIDESESERGAKMDDILGKLFKKSQIVRDAWNTIGYKSSIPPLYIDTVLWLLGKYVSAASKAEAFKNLVNDFGLDKINKIGEQYVKLLFNELLYKLPN
ncbi:MAG: N-glycosylase/DNA lyase [Sulfolobales archaeon]